MNFTYLDSFPVLYYLLINKEDAIISFAIMGIVLYTFKITETHPPRRGQNPFDNIYSKNQWQIIRKEIVLKNSL